MLDNVAVVLAAGQGVRMKSRIPKVLHRICGREMIGIVVDAVRAAGFQTTVVVARESNGIHRILGDTVNYAVQDVQLGTGHALLQAADLLPATGNILVLNGDVPLLEPATLAALTREHLTQGAVATITTATLDAPGDLGRVVRDRSGRVSAIVEKAADDDAARCIREVNVGLYCFDASWLWENLRALTPSASGEIYITDLVAAAALQGRRVAAMPIDRPDQIVGVNTRSELSRAEAVMRQRINEQLMMSGAAITDPATTYVDQGVSIGMDTTIYPNTHITGPSTVGEGCEIGPNTIVDASVIGNRCRVEASVVRGANLEDGVTVGPFAHLRQGTHLQAEVSIGSHAEIKASRLGRRTRSGHFCYIGDAQIGADVNIGAGTVTCNYDGLEKHHTRIEDGALIGSGSMLVAPIRIGARASTGAGAVVTRDVPPDALAVGVPARLRPCRLPHKGSEGGAPAR